MSDYSDIIFITAALMVFGMLTINTALSFKTTSDVMVQSDLEYRAMEIAQDEINAIRWVQATTKNGIKRPDPFDPDNETVYLYSDNPVDRTITYGSGDQYSETFKVYRTAELINETADQRRYKITIRVESEDIELPLSVSLDFIKTLTFVTINN